jgi:hypothetical protein
MIEVRQVAGSGSFFEKKEPKKLLSLPARQRRGTHIAVRRAQMDKSFFASFFSKKEGACLAATSLSAFPTP